MSKRLTPQKIELLALPVAQMIDEQGLHPFEVARQLDLSPGQIATIFIAGRRQRTREERERGDPISLLLPRVANVLRRIGLTAPAALRAAIDDGTLTWDSRSVLYRGKILRQVGWNSWQTLCEWAGAPRPEGGPRIVCPHCGKPIEL